MTVLFTVSCKKQGETIVHIPSLISFVKVALNLQHSQIFSMYQHYCVKDSHLHLSQQQKHYLKIGQD